MRIRKTQNNMSEFNTVSFIKAVKAQPAIWNSSTSEYGDRKSKLKAWEEVARQTFSDWESLQSPQKLEKGKEIQKKWKNIKYSFMKEYIATKHQQSNDIDPSKQKRKFVFFDQLLFLVAEFQRRKEERLGILKLTDSQHVDTEKFIKTVEKYPVLWNSEACGYQDREVKMKVWGTVATQVIPGWCELPEAEQTMLGIEIQKKWKTIRDSFLRSLKGQQKSVDVYARHLHFLLRHHKKLGEKSSKVPDMGNVLGGNPSMKRKKTHHTHAHSSATTAAGANQEWKKLQQEYHLAEKVNKWKNSVQVLQAQRKAGHKPVTFATAKEAVASPAEDYDKLFLLSLLPPMRSLSERNKMIARIELMQVLQRLSQTEDQRPASQQQAMQDEPDPLNTSDHDQSTFYSDHDQCPSSPGDCDSHQEDQMEFVCHKNDIIDVMNPFDIKSEVDIGPVWVEETKNELKNEMDKDLNE